MALAHPEIVRESAHGYAAYLDELIASRKLHASGQQAAQSLSDSIRRALATDDTKVVTDVSFPANLLLRCDSNERAALVNQWSLGIGNDGLSWRAGSHRTQPGYRMRGGRIIAIPPTITQLLPGIPGLLSPMCSEWP